MKIFAITFVVTFVLLLTGFYAVEHYVSIEIARENAEIASFTSQLPDPVKTTAADDFALPDRPSAPAAVQLPPHPSGSADVVSKAEDMEAPASVSAELPQLTTQNAEAREQLLAMGYHFDQSAFFTAITRDDRAAIELFLEAGMPLVPPLKFSYQPAADNPYLFYASQTSMLYNPLSLAIVASAGKSLPLLLSAAAAHNKLLMLNEMTCMERRQLDKSSHDLLGMALQGGNIQLLRSLITAGLKPLRQTYLLVALHAGKKAGKGELSPEARRQFFQQKADLMVELINAGQNVRQRFPTPFPVPPAMEIFFAITEKDIRSDLIARVASEPVRQELLGIADRLDRARRR